MINKLILLGPKYSAYDKYVNKLLKEYDRLIAESDTLPSFDGKNIIKVRMIIHNRLILKSRFI